MISALRKYIFLLRSIPKTLIFNMHYFPMKVAMKLPVLVSYNTFLESLGGKVVLNGKMELRRGLIKIGFGDVAVFDKYRSRTIWKNKGLVIFNGRADIGHGSKVAVGQNGIVSFGKNFQITAESEIICRKKIAFGDNCLLSWEVLLIDSDFHNIYDQDKRLLNPDEEILIGNNVWIGARGLVKKGISLAHRTIISAQSNVVKSIAIPNQIWGGNPAKLLRENCFRH